MSARAGPRTDALWLAVGAAALLALSVPAFWPQYLGKPMAGIDPYTHLHALLGVAWVLLLIAQALLMRGGRPRLHRVLGRTSYVVGPAFVVAGVLLAHHRASRMSDATFAAEAFGLYLPLMVAALFGLAFGLAVVHRRQAAVHARLMMATAVLLIDPVVVRLLFAGLPPLPWVQAYQAITFPVMASLLIALHRSLPPAVGRPLGRPGSGSIAGSLSARVDRGAAGRRSVAAFTAVAVMALGSWFVIPTTDRWLAVARWFRGLPLT